MSEDPGEVTVTVTMKGLRDPARAALQVGVFMHRALYGIQADADFEALITGPGFTRTVKGGGHADAEDLR